MATSYADDFAEFWSRYPRRVGKLAAKTAYEKARKSGVTQAELLAGLERYITTKPAWQDWCHPRTWLVQGRWLDEVEVPKPVEPWICRHTPRCPHRTACWVVSQRKAGA